MKVEEIAERALKLIETKRLEAPNDEIKESARELINGGKVLLKCIGETSEKNLIDILSSLKAMGVEIHPVKEESLQKKIPPPEVVALEEIYTEITEKDVPCLIEPDKICVNCSGRCKTLGF